MKKFDLATIRQDFPIVDECVYVNHAAVAPLPRSVHEAMNAQAVLRMTQTSSAWELAKPLYHEGRELAAELVGCSAEQIAWIQNTSHGISQIAAGIDWQAGDNVVVPEHEFPSNYYAWQNLAECDVELRQVQTVQGRLLPAEVSKQVDPRTRVVTMSHVQYFNGFKCDIAAIADICRRQDALFVVDGTQSVGAINIEVSDGVDALVVSAHKWMMGPLGIGFMALSQRALERIKVQQVGWLSISDPFNFRKSLDLLPDARRFEPGTENSAGIYGLTERLRTIDTLGAGAIEARVLALTDQLCEGAMQRGYQVTSPRGEDEKSAIVTFYHPKIASEGIIERLTEADIHASLRSGNIRVSPHYYNIEAEIDFVLETLPQ